MRKASTPTRIGSALAATIAAAALATLTVSLPATEAPVAATAVPDPFLWLDATNPASYPGTGLTWFDRSTNASHGALSGPSAGSITFDAANSALNFPGGVNGTAYLDLPGNFRDFGSGVTIEFEGHFGSNLSAWERIFDFAGPGSLTDALFVSRLGADNELAVGLYTSVTGPNLLQGHCYTATNNTALAAGATFQKWLVTIDNAGLCRIYRNGVELPTRLHTSGSFNTASAGANLAGSALGVPRTTDRTFAYLGRSTFAGDGDLEGSIRYLRMFNQALTPAQVQAVSTATVTFDANGGVGAMTPQSSTVSATLNLNAFGRNFHEFLGWNTATDGSGVAYAEGATYPFASDVTLYAQWSLIPGSLPEPLTTLPVPTTTVPETTVPEPTVAPEPSQPATPQPVLDIEGVLRELAAGETLVTEAGEEVTVEVIAETPDALAVEGDDFAVRVEGTPGGSTIELEPGGTVRVSGFGFQPVSQVDVWLFSDPTYLGALTVAADGTFDGRLPVPVLAPGEHTLQVNGVSSDGQVRSTSVGLVVRSVVAPEPVTDALPATGSDISPSLILVLLLVGTGLVAVATRRRSSPQHPAQLEG